MSKGRLRLGIVVVAVIAFAAPAYADAIQFNEALVKANKRLEDAGRAFGTLLEPALKGGPAEAAKLRKESDNVKKLVVDIRAEMKKVAVPPAASAKKFYAAHQSFLDLQDKLAGKDLPEIVRIVEDAKLDMQAKATKILEVLKRLDAAEKSELAKLQEAQRTFAREHNIKIK